MKSYLLVCCAVLLVSLNVQAGSKEEVKYYGQSTETLGLDIIKNETRYTYRSARGNRLYHKPKWELGFQFLVPFKTR